MKRSVVSIVVPFFREETQAPIALEGLLDAGRDLIEQGVVSDFELICVDDGSDDSTPRHLAAAAEADPRVRAVTHTHNRGLGAALRSGFAAASGDIVVYTDCDLPFDLSHLREGIELLRTSNGAVVNAYRFTRSGEGVRRFVYSYVYNGLISRLFRIDVKDVNFAAKFVWASDLDALDLRSEGSFIDAEILVRLINNGADVRQFGVRYLPRSRGTSTLSSASTIRGILAELRSIGPELRSGARERQ